MRIVVGFPLASEEFYAPLLEQGHEVTFGRPISEQRERPYSQQEQIALYAGADVAMTMSMSRPVMEALPGLRAIVALAIGVERIDVPAATGLGILVCNSPSVENIIGVAEAAVGQMLALTKRLKHKENLMRRGEWGGDSSRGRLLWQRMTIGLIGFGRIGVEVARRLAPWDIKLLVFDPFVPEERIREAGATRVDLPALLRESDVVSIHVTVTPETRGMIGEPQLRLMKPTAYLVNTARGEVLDEDAMVRALQDGWIAGAALDVFHEEPLPMESPLRQVDPERLILTPHNISHTFESRDGNVRLAVDSVARILRNEVPGTVVNPEVAERWLSRWGK